MRDEFKVHLLNADGLNKCDALAKLFSEFLEHLETIVPPGRERALVITKLQECSYFAKRGIAALPENQQ